MRKVMDVIVIVTLLVFVMSAQTLAAEKIFKIGIMAPMTGPAAKQGTELVNSAKMALEEIGNMIGDYKVELVMIDTQSDPAKATNAYAEAAERGGIQATLFDWNTSVSIACMELAAMYKIPHFSGFGAGEAVIAKYKSDPKFKGLWTKSWPVPGKYHKGYVECVNEAVSKGVLKPEKKRVALYGEDTDWGRDVAKNLAKMFTETGWEVASTDFFALAQTDFYPILSKYKQLGVSVLAGSSTSLPGITALMKQSQETGLKVVQIADGLGYAGEWYKMTGPASNYALDMLPQLATTKAKDWSKAYEKKFGISASPASSGMAYDGMRFFAKISRTALSKYKELNKETLHKVILEEVATGKLTYNREEGALMVKEYKFNADTMPDPVVGKDAFYFPVLQYMFGKGSVVFPDDIKEADFQAPK